jgi:hypothetical protein
LTNNICSNIFHHVVYFPSIFIFLDLKNNNIGISENNIVSVELAPGTMVLERSQCENRQKKIALLLTFILEHAHVKADESN